MPGTIRINLLRGDPAPAQQPGAKPAAAGDAAVVPTLTVDAGGRIVDAGEAALGLLDYTRQDLLSLALSAVVERMDNAILELAAKVVPAGRPVQIAALVQRRDGLTFPVEILVRSVERDAAGDWRMVLEFRQIPSQRAVPESLSAADARLSRAERLETAGTLAGQIAHDFNNLLTPLLAYPTLIRSEVPDNSVVAEYLNIIEKTTEDMARLTQQLLSLARRGHIAMEVFSPNEVIDSVLRLMKPVIPAGLNVELDLAENLLSVRGGRDQIRRVLENLIQNALDAMNGQGSLKIRTENVYLDAPFAQYGAIEVGEYAKISVADTGCGIPDAIKDRIFDPFFTTKRSSKKRGSGLGLSIVHGIVRDHRGYIEVDSSEGKGATFYIYLPIARQSVAPAAGDNLPHGTERILVVDDDLLQIQVLVGLLGVLGYKATGVQSGEECVKRIRDRGERYDLLILDMVMEGGMGGLETFMEVRKVVPNQKVMLISGFSKAARPIVKAQEMGAGAYLRKPLTIERVAMTVREELDMGGARAQGMVPTRGRRLLIVDDEPMIRRLFGMIILSEFPDTVIDQADNGREAVEAFSEGHHDLIIMDLQMPSMDGRESFMEIVRHCRRNRWAVPPVIFCTGFSPPESLNTIIENGAVHCLLRKPVKADALLHAVRQRLRG